MKVEKRLFVKLCSILAMMLLITIFIYNKQNTQNIKYFNSVSLLTNEIKSNDSITPFIPSNPIKKEYSGGYENTGYIEINYGISNDKLLSIIHDGAGIHAYIRIIMEDAIQFVYYDENVDSITLDILNNYIPNREDAKAPLNPDINDKWFDGVRNNFSVTAIDKVVEVPAGTFKTIEVTAVDDLGNKSYHYYANGFGLIRSESLGYETELLSYDYVVNLNGNLLD